jgi:hypothetical protein
MSDAIGCLIIAALTGAFFGFGIFMIGRIAPKDSGDEHGASEGDLQNFCVRAIEDEFHGEGR